MSRERIDGIRTRLRLALERLAPAGGVTAGFRQDHGAALAELEEVDTELLELYLDELAAERQRLAG